MPWPQPGEGVSGREKGGRTRGRRKDEEVGLVEGEEDREEEGMRERDAEGTGVSMSGNGNGNGRRVR